MPPGVDETVRPVDPLKYQRREVNAAAAQSGEVATVKLRFKQPDGETSVERAIVAYDAGGSWTQASSELRFAAAVASFGMILRDSPQRGTATLALVNQLAQSAGAFDPNGHRAAFLAMVAKTQPLLATPIASAE